MKFNIEQKDSPAKGDYHKQDMELAYSFAKKTYKEFGSFLKAIVLFGSSARREKKKEGDIDILLIVDDVSMVLSADVVEAYRIIVEKIIADTSDKIHVTTLKFTSFWEYVRAGDPVGVNILRDGLVLLDSGFFEPLQSLLVQGRIRPSPESVWVYFARAPRTLHNSRWHLVQATLDLYWAVIDSAHSALMKLGEIPPSPSHVADLLDEKLVKKGLLEKKYVKTMKNFYELAKKIGHKEIRSIEGKHYDKYLLDARDFVERMKKYILGPDK
ncbi:nucleotidyltransferase domain-containing protein [Candidatus Woesearchaeota archaeon]|nr:nucleotidyltransferase domain-containing protein [Candidatus Woesearchaeota archaeon]